MPYLKLNRKLILRRGSRPTTWRRPTTGWTSTPRPEHVAVHPGKDIPSLGPETRNNMTIDQLRMDPTVLEVLIFCGSNKTRESILV